MDNENIQIRAETTGIKLRIYLRTILIFGGFALLLASAWNFLLVGQNMTSYVALAPVRTLIWVDVLGNNSPFVPLVVDGLLMGVGAALAKIGMS